MRLEVDPIVARWLSLLLDRLRLVLAPLDRLEELLLLTDPLLLLFELDRFLLTFPVLRLLELDRLLFTEPLLLLFDRVRFTVPDDRFVFVLDRFTVDLLLVLEVDLDRIELDDLVWLTVLLLLVT